MRFLPRLFVGGGLCRPNCRRTRNTPIRGGGGGGGRPDKPPLGVCMDFVQGSYQCSPRTNRGSTIILSKRKVSTVNDVSDARFESKYAVWKERLLDLTANNRLLNFRETKVSTVQITSPDPIALFEAIVLRERSLKFPLYRGRTVLGETQRCAVSTR